MCTGLEDVDGGDECLGINALQARSALAEAGHRAGSSIRPSTASMASGGVPLQRHPPRIKLSLFPSMATMNKCLALMSKS
jgi:hypothetical protein